MGGGTRWGLVHHRTDSGQHLVRVQNLGNVGGFQALLNENVEEALESRDADGRGVLHWCAELNRPEELLLCVAAGMPADEADEDGWTPLHVGTAHNHSACVELLLKHGSDPLKKVAGSLNNSLHIAASRGYVECLRLILQAITTQDVSTQGVSTQGVQEVNGPGPVDIPNAYGQTPLMRAVVAQHSVVARILIETGANTKTRLERTNECLLHVAVGNGDVETCKVLLEADPTLADLSDNVCQPPPPSLPPFTYFY
ncbi:ankyrin repeat protein [Gregarina niphandrodes]|uniref:Ankyrin repeat protein n=1 Tax=Gregarina niphandrodes TaxID=110365 RepID=A0A023BD07_GRENI|nr:ankyrin repeat protein [Gregarina niphandrodes]EZG86317.1 ankyrin repeat protein [Gregarina niphandrodes]|eukprot:XP_011128768.1 ankyrin repeat protein [Gregarina niphandrodes]